MRITTAIILYFIVALTSVSQNSPVWYYEDSWDTLDYDTSYRALLLQSSDTSNLTFYRSSGVRYVHSWHDRYVYDDSVSQYSSTAYLPVFHTDSGCAYDGDDDRLTSQENLLSDGANVFSACAWVVPGFDYNDGGYPSVVGNLTDNASVGWAIDYNTQVDKFRWGVRTYDKWLPLFDDVVTSNAELGKGEWKHICGTYRNGESRLYVDGELVNSRDDGGGGLKINTSTKERIGANFAFSGNGFWHGTIRNVLIFEDYLTPCDISEMYEAGPDLVK